MNREAMIRQLVAYSVESALREPQAYWLHELFEKGFAGYRKFSHSRLKRELELRGLGDVDDAGTEDDGMEDCDINDASETLALCAAREREFE